MSFDDQGGTGPEVLSTRSLPKGQSVLAQVEAYWRSLRGSRALPLRSDVDPSRIEAALPHSFIVERVAPGLARLRVAGQALSGYLGADARGMPLSAFFGAAARPVLRDHLDRAFDEPAVVELPLASGRGPLRQPLTGRLLLLPLLGNEGEATRALGALVVEGPAARGPRQFEIPAGATIRCERVTAPASGAARMAAVRGSAQGWAQGSARPRPDDRPALAASERPWLRLVVSNG